MFLAAFLFSTGGAAIKACSLAGWQVASIRSGIAAIALWVLLPEARRNWTWRTVVSGLPYAATLISFALANKLTSAANAIYLQATAPLYLLALGPLLLKERIRRVDVLVMTGVAAGASLLFAADSSAGATAANPALGNLLAAGSGFTWALTLVALRWQGRTSSTGEHAASTVIAGNAIVFLACLGPSWPFPRPAIADLGALLYLGLIQVALAYYALTRSIRHVPALEAATLLLAEPVFNPLWAWMLMGERPGRLTFAGGAIIILVSFGGTWWQSRRA